MAQEDKYLAQADLIPQDPITGCKIWTGRITGKGYAAFGRRYRGNRAILKRKLGRDLLPGMYALHTCDNRACVSEDHLYEGTHQDNMDDMVRRGRSLTGDKNPMNIYPEKRTTGDKHWTHHRVHPLLGTKTPEHRIRRGVKHPFAKLTEWEVLEIRRLKRTTSLSDKEIGAIFNVTGNRVYHIVTYRQWRHLP